MSPGSQWWEHQVFNLLAMAYDIFAIFSSTLEATSLFMFSLVIKEELNIFLFYSKGNCNTNPCRSHRRKRVSGDIESGSMVEKRRKEKNNKKKKAKEKMAKEKKVRGKMKKEKRKKKEKKKKWKNIYTLLKRLQSWLRKRLKRLALYKGPKSAT